MKANRGATYSFIGDYKRSRERSTRNIILGGMFDTRSSAYGGLTIFFRNLRNNSYYFMILCYPEYWRHSSLLNIHYVAKDLIEIWSPCGIILRKIFGEYSFKSWRKVLVTHTMIDIFHFFILVFVSFSLFSLR